MLVKYKTGTEGVHTSAYFKNGKQRQTAIKNIMNKRKAATYFYNLMPLKEKITSRKAVAKWTRLNRKKALEANKKWIKNNPKKYTALKKKASKKYYTKHSTAIRWIKTNRKKVLDIKGKICKKCGSKVQLQIHHKKYTTNLKDLEILCMKCHKKLDRKYSDEELGIGG